MKQLEEEALREIVSKIAGKNAAVIVSILKSKDNVDEFKIAQKSEMTINELRNILYKLHHHDLVTFTRKKDSKKGWFIYYWTLDNEKSLKCLVNDYVHELNNQKILLDNKLKKNYFICPSGHIELAEESALEQNFECIECGELLVLKDKEIERRKIKKNIVQFEERIEEIKALIIKYEKARASKIEAEIESEKQEKALRRAERKKERDKEKEKLAKTLKKTKKTKTKTTTKKTVKKITKKVAKKPVKKKTTTKKVVKKKPVVSTKKKTSAKSKTLKKPALKSKKK